MKRKMKQVSLFILAIQLLLPALAFSSESFEDKIMKVSPGMKKDEAIALLGNPDSVAEKFLNKDGKVVPIGFTGRGGGLTHQGSMSLAF